MSVSAPDDCYDGYDDYQDAVTYDYTDDLDESDEGYDQELEVSKYMRV